MKKSFLSFSYGQHRQVTRSTSLSVRGQMDGQCRVGKLWYFESLCCEVRFFNSTAPSSAFELMLLRSCVKLEMIYLISE